MKREEFKEAMKEAIKEQERIRYYSCPTMPRNFSRDYRAMFSSDAVDGHISTWFNNSCGYGYSLNNEERQQERLGMLELFEQVALDSKLYTRY